MPLMRDMQRVRFPNLLLAGVIFFVFTFVILGIQTFLLLI